MRAASQPVQSPTNSTSKASVDAVPGDDLGPDPLRETSDVGREALLVVDDEVRVLLGDDRPADAQPLQPGRVDQSPGRVAGRIAEDAAGRREPERLVCLPPAADLVEPCLDRSRVRGRQPEGRVDDDVARRRRSGVVARVLEPAVAVGQPEVGRRDDGLAAVGGEDAGRLQHARHVGIVRAGVGPHRAADRARDRQPELEPGQARMLGLRRRPRHLDAGLGRVAIAVGP